MTWSRGAFIWPRACEPCLVRAVHLSERNWPLLARPHSAQCSSLGSHVLGSATGVFCDLFVDLERLPCRAKASG